MVRIGISSKLKVSRGEPPRREQRPFNGNVVKRADLNNLPQRFLGNAPNKTRVARTREAWKFARVDRYQRHRLRVERSERAALKPWQSLRNRRDDRANDVTGLQIEKNRNLRLAFATRRDTI